MAEPTHFEKFAEHILNGVDSAIGKVRAERDYALHCLEREIAIAHAEQVKNAALVQAIKDIKQATIDGRVCDDVAWFDTITTLHDFCDQTLDLVAGVKQP